MTTSTVRKIHIAIGALRATLPVEISSWGEMQKLMSGFADTINGYLVATVKIDVGQEGHQELLYFAYAGDWTAADIDGYQDVEEFFLKQVGVNKYGW